MTQKEYKKRVKTLTKRYLLKYGHLLFDYSLLIAKFSHSLCKSYNIDHKFSKCKGFYLRIPPEIIAFPHNIEFILESTNSLKSHKCSITKEELLKQFYYWACKINDQELINIYEKYNGKVKTTQILD